MEAVRVRKPKTKKVKEKTYDANESQEFLHEETAEKDAAEGKEHAENFSATANLLSESVPVAHHEPLDPDKMLDENGSDIVLACEGAFEKRDKVENVKKTDTFPEAVAESLTNFPLIPELSVINTTVSESSRIATLNTVQEKPVEKYAQPNVISRNPLARNRSPAEVVKSSAPLYPSLLEKQKVVVEQKPLSRGEMRMYFVNAEARALEATIDQFIETNLVASFHRHPLHIYLNEYLKAITAYEAALQDLKKLQRLYEQTREDVWKITDNRVAETGKCGDNKTVTGEQFYRQCHLNKIALAELETHLESIRHFLYDTSFGFKCTAELARFQVECFLFDVIRGNPVTGGLQDDAPTTSRSDWLKVPETAEIRVCVSILFAFHRVPLGSEKFRSDIKVWLTGCVGILIRASTFFDELFLLNHLLRCPSSVLTWASCFLQISLPSTFSGKNCHNPYVKHLMTMLQCVLQPTKARDDFLSAFSINQSFDDSRDGDSTWIVLDPDVEEDGTGGMKLTTTMEVQENDVFYLLKQFPFDRLFSCLCGSDCVDLEPFVHVTEYDVLGLFSFCHEFLELLVEGLDNPALNKYSRINKRIAQLVRELIIHCKEFWERLLECKTPGDPVLLKLGLNFEELLLRGMSLLLLHGKNGTLQFLVGWPTQHLSLPNLWRSVVMLESSHDVEVSYRGDVFSWKKQLADLHSGLKLQEKLQSLDESNATYLLTVLAEILKQSGKQHTALDLVESVAMELLRISFLGPLRSTYAKLGRDLICSVCAEYPSLMSDVARFMWKNLDQVGSMAVFLFQEMPLKLWQISRMDMDTVCERLVGAQTIQSFDGLLAREILSNLNWGFMESGELFVEASLHQFVAVAVVEAFLKFISTKNRRLLLYESLLRLSNMVTTGKQLPDQIFVGWCWEVLLDLKLHHLAQRPGDVSTLRNNAINDAEIPNLSRDAVTLSPLMAVQQRQPIACYVAVMLTDIGHSTTGVLNQGLDWVAALVENYLYIPALEVLQFVTPLFFSNNQATYLLQHDQFHYILNGLLQADATYLRMVKNILAFEFPGKTLKSFGNMVTHQLLHAGYNLPLAIHFWCRVLTSLKNWNRTSETLYILDQVVKFAFYAREMHGVMDVLREAYEEYRQSQPTRGGGMTVLVSWMTSGSSPAYILIDSAKLAASPWLGYAVLQVVTESSSGLWSVFLDLLTGDKKRTFEEGLKKAAHKLDMSVPALSDLPLFQIAETIIAVSVEEEIFPLLCQEFFRLFLQRSVTHASIGDQFFLSSQATRLLKPMKQKLRDAADFYRARGSASDERHPQFFRDLQQAVRAFALWMDEPKLHHANLYLPSLPPEYQPELLNTILNSNSEPWLHFVDVQCLYTSMRTQAEHWLPFEVRSRPRRASNLSSPIRCQDSPLPAPSTLPAAPPFVPVDTKSLFDPTKILFALRPDLTTIQEAAKTFVGRVVEHGSLDGYFMELIADLNSNVEKQTTVFASCKKGHCAEPAEILLTYKEFTRNDPVHREYLQNREEWNNIVSRAPKVDLKPLVMSVVRFEKAISHLLAESKSVGGPKAAEVGAVLFYHILLFIGQESDEHPLTRKFFHSCLEVLGQNFIANQKHQCRPLLETCLNNQRAIPMLISHFTPNIVPQDFLLMYKKSHQILQGKNNEALIQLLSTFDVPQYLSDSSVNVGLRMELLSALAHGISQLGSTPSFEDSPLFEVYAHHIRSLLEFRFPLHVVDVLKCLLDLTGKNLLPSNGWSSCFFSAFGISAQTENTSDDVATLERDFAEIREAMADNRRISLDLALVVASELIRFFAQLRRENKTAIAFGLFSILGQYTRAWAVLFFTLASISLRDDPKPEGTFAFTVPLFQAWINEEHAFLQADLPLATTLITTLRLIFAQVIAKDPQILRFIWQWYYHSFSVTPAESYALMAISVQLAALPWEKFHPDPICLRQFVLITESGSQEVRTFLGDLLERIPWRTALSINQSTHPQYGHVLSDQSSNQSTTHSMNSTSLTALPFLLDVLKVMVFYGTDDKFRPFNKGISHFICETTTFGWGCLDYAALQSVTRLLARDPETVGKWCVGSGDAVESCSIVALLKLITEFDSDNSSPTQFTAEKRALFLQIYGRAAVAYYTAKIPASLTSFILTTLKTIEKIWQSAEPQIRHRGYLALASEIFSLSNYVADRKIENLIRGAILTWVGENAGSLLLIPMISACCRCVVNVEAMVAYLEALITSHFQAVGQHDWRPVVYVLETPELSSADFVKTCLGKQAFLTLHAHFLRVVQTADAFRRAELLQSLVEWCKVRPTPESQAKVFLLWNHILILGANEPPERSAIPIREFIEAIFAFTEEKGGLLSAIGVGKPSALSRPFKIIVRSIAAVASPLTVSSRKSNGKSTNLTLDTRNVYEAMKIRKEYLPYSEVWSLVDERLSVQDSLNFSDIRKLFVALVAILFEQHNYLSTLSECH